MKKAMLLAAGRGRRLKPLTDSTPKPLIQVNGQSLIEHNLYALSAAGFEAVLINVCYRAEQVIAVVGDGARYGLEVNFSYEPDTPLGTGGGIFQGLHFFEDDPFVVLSSDIWSDYPFSKLALSQGQLAHLVMVPNPDFHPVGDYGLTPTGKITYSSSGAPSYTYASMGVLTRDFFAKAPSGRFALSSLLTPAIAAQRVTGELYNGPWFNIGTVEELARLNAYLSKT